MSHFPGISGVVGNESAFCFQLVCKNVVSDTTIDYSLQMYSVFIHSFCGCRFLGNFITYESTINSFSF